MPNDNIQWVTEDFNASYNPKDLNWAIDYTQIKEHKFDIEMKSRPQAEDRNDFILSGAL